MGKIKWPDFGFLGLLICLVSLLVVAPILEAYSRIQPVLAIFTTALLIFSVYSFLNKKRVLIIASLLAAPALIFNWISYSFQSSTTLLIYYTFNAVFFVFIIVSMIAELLKKDVITLDLIYGTICVYLLIGVAWAFVFATLEHIFPGSYNLPSNYLQANPSIYSGEVKLSLFLYYSYVTLTTLGYGDITPVTSPAHSLATLEAIMGQFYIAVLVAHLVGMHVSSNSQR